MNRMLRTLFVGSLLITSALRADVPSPAAQAIKSLIQHDSTYAPRLIEEIGISEGSDWLDKVYAAWLEVDAVGALNWAVEQPDGNIRDLLLYAAIRRMANFQPDIIKDYVKEIADRKQRSTATGLVSVALMQRDPALAFDWLSTFEGEEGWAALSIAFHTLSDADPALAAKFFPADAHTEQYKPAASRIADNFALLDPIGGMEWIATLRGEIRDKAEFSLVAELGFRYPVDVASYLQKTDPKQKKSNLYQNLASQWAQVDPEAAMAWTLSLKPNRVGKVTTQAAIGAWLQSYPEDVAVWLLELPEGSLSDIATGEYIRSMADYDPAGALDLAVTLSGVERNNALSSIVLGWYKFDPERGRESITADTRLTNEEKARMLEKLGQWY